METATTSRSEDVSVETLTRTIVERVAEREGTSPAELSPPLYSAIDADALCSFVRSLTAGESGAPGGVRFRYDGYEVRVCGDGSVSVTQA